MSSVYTLKTSDTQSYQSNSRGNILRHSMELQTRSMAPSLIYMVTFSLHKIIKRIVSKLSSAGGA